MMVVMVFELRFWRQLVLETKLTTEVVDAMSCTVLPDDVFHKHLSEQLRFIAVVSFVSFISFRRE
jgi:hypothetical protein